MRKLILTIIICLAFTTTAFAASSPSKRELQLEGQNIILKLQLMQYEAKQLKQRLDVIKKQLKSMEDTAQETEKKDASGTR